MIFTTTQIKHKHGYDSVSDEDIELKFGVIVAETDPQHGDKLLFGINSVCLQNSSINC